MFKKNYMAHLLTKFKQNKASDKGFNAFLKNVFLNVQFQRYYVYVL